MPTYLLIEDFKEGLDSRRSRATAKAGTLYNLVNAHINRGGEIEKRYAFVEYAALPIGQTFGLISANSNLYTFGSLASPSVPAGVQYQQLVHPSGLAMTGIVYLETFNGAIYAVAQFSDGSIYAYYGGVRVTSWDAIVVAGGGNPAVADAFAALINVDTNFTSSVIGAGNVVEVIEKNNNVPFTVVAVPTAGGVGAPTMAVATTQTAAAAIPEVLATGTFTVTGGTSGSGHQLTNLQVNSIEVLGSPVAWATSNAVTATAIAAQITSFASTTTPKYTATASGAVVTIQAFTGSGATPNGFTITFTAVNLTGTDTAFSGGVTAVPAQAQISTITVGGTFDPGNTYQIALTVASVPYAKTYYASGNSLGIATIVKTFQSKMYGQAGGVQYFSSINDPTTWATSTINGSGFIVMSNQDSGSETLTGMGVYLGHLAVFARRTIQLWLMNADPTQNDLTQTLNNIGTYAPRSVINFGDLNLFFISDVGIRSLIPRDASGNAVISDVGTPIDTIVQANNLTLDESIVANSCALIEPNSGRYWCAVGPYIYVYSLYPTSQVTAWSIYSPGFNVDDMVYSNGLVYLRSGDTVYVYGGSNGVQYDNALVTVETPYLDGGKPANFKTFRGVDGAFDNTWEVSIGTDPAAPTAKDLIGTVTGVTYSTLDDTFDSKGTHFGVLLTCNSPGYARISNLAIHFDDNGPKD